MKTESSVINYEINDLHKSLIALFFRQIKNHTHTPYPPSKSVLNYVYLLHYHNIVRIK